MLLLNSGLERLAQRLPRSCIGANNEQRSAPFATLIACDMGWIAPAQVNSDVVSRCCGAQTAREGGGHVAKQMSLPTRPADSETLTPIDCCQDTESGA